jgi:DMSO/TMAO reductase YedYZ molybdopterin-dependent catalytic subunit
MAPARLWAIAGAAAAALAVGTAELVGGLLGGPSLVAAIGAVIIELQPPGAKDLMVLLFGEADKLVLEAATAVAAIAIGALLGLVARRSVRLAQAGIVLFGGVAFVAAQRDPLTDLLAAAITVGTAVAVGLFVLDGQLRPLETTLAGPPAATDAQSVDRRRFLAFGGTLVLAGAVTAIVGRFLTLQLPEVAAPAPIPSPRQSLPPVPAGAALDVPGITPIIVPNEDFYRIDTRLTVPRLDAETWALRVHGLVEREVTLAYADLLAMPLVERYVTIACVSNEVGGHLVGNARWTGVRLSQVLESAGVRPEASQLVGRSFDGWTAGFPTAHLEGAGGDALIALQMNGEVLPARNGFPARLIVPGLFGYVSATKWLTEIELTTMEAFDAYWVPLGWAKEAPILTQSRIDVPSPGARVASGSTIVAGVAWAPTRRISRVEVQLDDGPWQPAELSVALSDAAWVQWQAAVDVAPGDHSLRVRATDGTGEVQTAERTPPAPDGARGHHEVRFSAG